MESLTPSPGFSPWTVKPVVSHYTIYTIPALKKDLKYIYIYISPIMEVYIPIIIYICMLNFLYAVSGKVYIRPHLCKVGGLCNLEGRGACISGPHVHN